MIEVCHSLFTLLSGHKKIKGRRTDAEETTAFERKKGKKLEKPDKKLTVFIHDLKCSVFLFMCVLAGDW